MSVSKVRTDKVPSALAIGIARGGLEVKQFMRQRESVVFTLAFPIMLLAIFGSVFTNELTDGVTFSQYFVAGMIASGLVNTGFQQLAIMIPVERDFGTLKRLQGTPMPASSYFIGKSIVVFVTMVIQVALLLIAGVLFFGVNLPTDPEKWLTFTWLIILGSAASTALGIASQRKETIAVLGDLGFLHDLTGLIHNEDINLKILVVNNDGGGIFSTLSQRGVAGFEEVFGTPHGRDLAAIAGAIGVPAKTISTQAELKSELMAPIKGVSVVVITAPDREANADFLKKVYSQVDSM